MHHIAHTCAKLLRAPVGRGCSQDTHLCTYRRQGVSVEIARTTAMHRCECTGQHYLATVHTYIMGLKYMIVYSIQQAIKILLNVLWVAATAAGYTGSDLRMFVGMAGNLTVGPGDERSANCRHAKAVRLLLTLPKSSHVHRRRLHSHSHCHAKFLPLKMERRQCW